MRSRTAFLAAAALTAAATGTATAVTAPGAAAAGCTVAYTVQTQWDSGFTSGVTVTNTGDPVSGWNLTWTFAGNQRVTQGWNADLAQSGAGVTARNVAHNGTLATGASASFGFNASYSGSNAVPATFKLNGVTCNAGPVDPTDPPTDPPGPGARVDNPYAGAKVYVNPEWSARAAAEPGGTGSPTGPPESGSTEPPRSRASGAPWACATTSTQR